MARRRSRDNRRSTLPIERRYARTIKTEAVEPIISALRADVLPMVRRLRKEDGASIRLDQDDADEEDILTVLRRIRRTVGSHARRTRPTIRRTLGRTSKQQAAELEEEIGASVKSLARSHTVRLRRERRRRTAPSDLAVAAHRWSPSRLGKRAVDEMGVDPFGGEPWLEEAMREATRQNVDLIQSIPARMLDEVEELVIEAARSGMRNETLAKRISERFGIALRRAELIAQDQVGKFYGSLDERRMRAVGSKQYRWRTSRDERVRKKHRNREGKLFLWDEPPDDGHPGQPVRCRCTAEPVIPGLEDLL